MKQYRMGRTVRNSFGTASAYTIDVYEGVGDARLEIITVENRALAEQIIDLLNRVEAPSTDPMHQTAFTINGKSLVVRGSREACEAVMELAEAFKGTAHHFALSTPFGERLMKEGDLRRRMEELEKNMHALAADMRTWKDT